MLIFYNVFLVMSKDIVIFFESYLWYFIKAFTYLCPSFLHLFIPKYHLILSDVKQANEDEYYA